MEKKKKKGRTFMWLMNLHLLDSVIDQNMYMHIE